MTDATNLMAVGLRCSCTIGECQRPYLARGMCRMHYERDRRGAPLEETPPKRQPITVRFWAKVEMTDCCWLWTGALIGRDKAVGGGYGYFDQGPDHSYYAHRFAWEQREGPIPAGLVIDHLCRVRRCVNPDHLELVTPRVNSMRGARWTEAKEPCCGN